MTADAPEAAEASPRERMRRQMERLYPICRSITGDGVRRTLAVVGESVPVTVHEVASGETAFGWTINDEWNVADAYVAQGGRRLVDFGEHNLHLVGYSVPIRASLTFEELRPHLSTLPDHPDWIPYRTSYYRRDWGFCLRHRDLQAFDTDPQARYDVVVDSTLEPGSMTYGEILLPGEVDDEVLISAHVCHPSLANDNLSGIAVATEVVRALAARPHRLSYRVLLAPGTIGSVLWLSRNEEASARIRHGLVLTGLGGPGPLTYKRTRDGHRSVDAAATAVVGRRDGDVRDYSPYGYDERQFGSLGFDLAVGRLSRTPHGEYPEYHTSADDLDLVTDDRLEEALAAVLEVLDLLETDAGYRNLSPHGEPQLGRYGLYPSVGGQAADDEVMAMLWTLGLSDGRTGLLGIAGRSGVPVSRLEEVAGRLEGAGLLRREW
jgi:aminopeptidase-like protein